MHKRIFVLYHSPCYDGFGSAYSAWKLFKESSETSVRYIPVDYHLPLPLTDEEIRGSHIFITDFSYPKEELLRIKDLAIDVTVLDHHKTAEESLKGLSFAHFDMDKSGAMMTWNHFHPNTPAPKLIQYIQDRDLWRWKLPHSKEVNAVIQSLPISGPEHFSVFESYENLLETNLSEIVSQGEAILRSVNQYVKLAIQRSFSFKDIDGYRIPAVNTSILESETGNLLLELHPDALFSGTYYENEKGEEKWSLRSRGDFDVGAIAKRLGGGGHKAAAGFTRKNR